MMRCRRVNVRSPVWGKPQLLSLLVVTVLLPVHAAVADDAMVLPQGRWRVSTEARFSLPITKRFTEDGGTEALAVDFNRELNSTVFTDLQLVETAFRLPAGSATFGRSVVDFERHARIYTVQAAYGLTGYPLKAGHLLTLMT